MNEVWKPVKGYENCYEISNFGRCRSIPRTIIRKANEGEARKRRVSGEVTLSGRVLRPILGNNVLFYRLYSIDSDKRKTLSIARLMNDNFEPDELPYDVKTIIRKLRESAQQSHRDMPHRCRILCKETGYVYRSIAELSRELGVNYDLVRRRIESGHSIKGLNFVKIYEDKIK